MSEANMLAKVISAIETAEGANTDKLKAFCADNGLGKEDVDFLVAADAPTTPGRVQARIDFNAQLEAEAKEAKNAKGSKSKAA